MPRSVEVDSHHITAEKAPFHQLWDLEGLREDGLPIPELTTLAEYIEAT
jgi:hypothetical protein